MGNMDTDPMFEDHENRNYNLLENSPCIDSGDPNLFDPDDTRSDIGAFYYDQNTTRVINLNGDSFIKIFPNPANDFINIAASNYEIIELTIMASNGKEIMKLPIHENTMIPLENLLPGVYYYTFKGKDIFYTEKVIILK